MAVPVQAQESARHSFEVVHICWMADGRALLNGAPQLEPKAKVRNVEH
jgi:hypothetical protein